MGMLLAASALGTVADLSLCTRILLRFVTVCTLAIVLAASALGTVADRDRDTVRKGNSETVHA
jgi:hypothetical protein